MSNLNDENRQILNSLIVDYDVLFEIYKTVERLCSVIQDKAITAFDSIERFVESPSEVNVVESEVAKEAMRRVGPEVSAPIFEIIQDGEFEFANAVLQCATSIRTIKSILSDLSGHIRTIEDVAKTGEVYMNHIFNVLERVRRSKSIVFGLLNISIKLDAILDQSAIILTDAGLVASLSENKLKIMRNRKEERKALAVVADLDNGIRKSWRRHQNDMVYYMDEESLVGILYSFDTPDQRIEFLDTMSDKERIGLIKSLSSMMQVSLKYRSNIEGLFNQILEKESVLLWGRNQGEYIELKDNAKLYLNKINSYVDHLWSMVIGIPEWDLYSRFSNLEIE